MKRTLTIIGAKLPAPAALYNLDTDPGETKNLHAECPEIVVELKALLEQSKSTGRSRPTSTP